MGEIINLEKFKKQQGEKQEAEKQRLLKDDLERNKIAESINIEQLMMIEYIVRCSYINKESISYRAASVELNKKSMVEIRDIISNAREEAVLMKPEYFKIALDIINGDYKNGE